MANEYDQFDNSDGSGNAGNPYDQFDNSDGSGNAVHQMAGNGNPYDQFDVQSAPQSIGDIAKHQASMIGADIVKGATGLPTLLSNIPGETANATRYLADKVAGVEQQSPPIPFYNPFGEEVDAILGKSDQPKNAAERLENNIITPIAGVASGGALASALKSGGGILENALASNLPAQYGGAITGGVVTDAAQEAKLPEWAQVGSGVVGAVAGGGATGAANSLIQAIKKSPEDIAIGRMARDFGRDNITPEQAQTILTHSPDNAMLADVGGSNVKSLGRTAINTPGSGSNNAVNNLIGRQSGASQTVQDIVKSSFGANDEFNATLSNLQAAQKANSAPLYEKAYEGGSIAPLESQFEESLNTASSAKATADKAVSDAQNKLTQAKAQESRAGNNVYQTSGANSAIKQAQNDFDTALEQQKAANQSVNDVTDSLRQAQADRANGVKGAVWNPRIQQFLQQPEMQVGIQRGLKEIRLESIGNDTPFNPYEYGVTGTDEAGNSIISKVPNMRLLDAGKKGIDAMINDQTDSVTGKMTSLGRSLTIFKNGLVKQLDAINPDYAPARQAFSGPAQSETALKMGRNFLNEDAETTADDVTNLSQGDKKFFQLGAARAISDKAAANPNATVKNIVSNDLWKQKLQAAMPSKAAYYDFMTEARNQANQSATKNAVLGNSTTAGQLIKSGEDTPQEGMLNLGNIVDAAKGNWLGVGVQVGKKVLQRFMTPPDVSKQLSDMLFNTNPSMNQDTIAAWQNYLKGQQPTPFVNKTIPYGAGALYQNYNQ